MGRLHTVEEQRETLVWGEGYRGEIVSLDSLALSSIQQSYYLSLRRYFALACLSRSTTAPTELVSRAKSVVFAVRVRIERSIINAIQARLQAQPEELSCLFTGSFFGSSKKQGTSVRFPLSTCHPTKLCGPGCYAHDVLDAATGSVVRGAVNGAIAHQFEEGTEEARAIILAHLQAHTRRAVKSALDELKQLPPDWVRRAYIRFSHVGEIVAFPLFAQALARQVALLSNDKVDCVVYTRHPKARELDPSLFVLNFTLDGASAERRDWIPEEARIVYSAFGGEISAEADVNFLEHHRWRHLPPIGEGRVCPATLPDTLERTCDAVRCDRCFQRPHHRGQSLPLV